MINLDELIDTYNGLETAEERYQLFNNIRLAYKKLDKLTDELTFCHKCNQHIYIKDLVTKFDTWEDWENENALDPLEQAKWIKVTKDGFRKHCPLCDDVMGYFYG